VGGANEDGVVHEVDAMSETEKVLHSFASDGRRNSPGGLTEARGLLYKTASGGGTDNLGVVLKVKKK
jgi:hypothetical protein